MGLIRPTIDSVFLWVFSAYPFSNESNESNGHTFTCGYFAHKSMDTRCRTLPMSIREFTFHQSMFTSNSVLYFV